MTKFLIAEALANETSSEVNQTENTNKNEVSAASFLPLIAIFVIFYFLIIRPQSKKHKEHQQLLKQLKIGNKVITSGGIVGIVREILEKEDQIRIEIAEEVIITILRQHVAQVEKASEKAELDEKKSSKALKNKKS